MINSIKLTNFLEPEVHDNTRWKGFKEVDIEYEIKFRDNLGYIYSTGSVVEDLFNRTVSYDYIPYLELSEEIQSSLRGVSINTSNLELSSLDRHLAEIALALLSKTLKEMRRNNIGVSETYIKEY